MKTVRAEELDEEGFFATTRSQARELRRFARTRPNVALDMGRIAEEIADLGRERRDALRSWTARIIEHLPLLSIFPRRRRDAAGSTRSSICGARSTAASA